MYGPLGCEKDADFIRQVVCKAYTFLKGMQKRSVNGAERPGIGRAVELCYARLE
jgi:hypothetical protein